MNHLFPKPQSPAFSADDTAASSSSERIQHAAPIDAAAGGLPRTTESPPASPAAAPSDAWILPVAGLLALLATALFYEIFPVPFLKPGRSLDVFDHWVSQLIVGFAWWPLFLLAFRLRRYRREFRLYRAFCAPAVHALWGQGIYAARAEETLQRLQGTLPPEIRQRTPHSMLYRRVAAVLMHLRSVTEREELSTFLGYQAEIDQKRLDSTYAAPQVFIWAIPILGFIGTVLGISDAVQEFALFIQSSGEGGALGTQLRSALGGVTSGLAVAFQTTFLALVLVIPVMLAASLMQKSEEELLSHWEIYCLESILPHLHLTPGETAATGEWREHLHRITQLSHLWVEQLEPLVGRLSQQTETVSEQLAGFQPAMKDFTDRLLDEPGDAPRAHAGQTPAPAGQTPAPTGDTPAPTGDTPAPAGDTPAPTGDTPAPAGEEKIAGSASATDKR